MNTLDNGLRRLGLGLEAKREGLGLAREKFERESCGALLEWVRNAGGRGIGEGPITNSERIALLRQALFADVDELEKSGEVVLPEWSRIKDKG